MLGKVKNKMKAYLNYTKNIDYLITYAYIERIIQLYKISCLWFFFVNSGFFKLV